MFTYVGNKNIHKVKGLQFFHGSLVRYGNIYLLIKKVHSEDRYCVSLVEAYLEKISHL